MHAYPDGSFDTLMCRDNTHTFICVCQAEACECDSHGSRAKRASLGALRIEAAEVDYHYIAMINPNKQSPLWPNLMAKFALAMDVPVTTLMCSACATFEATRRKHYGTTHCMLGGAIDGGHCDILFAYTNVRIVDKVANDESRKKKARQLSESAHVDNAESTHTYTFGHLIQPGQRFYT